MGDLKSQPNEALSFPSFVPDQSYIGRSLTENKYFLHFLNIAVSNFGDQKQVEELKKAITHHFLAQRMSLRSDYMAAFYEIRRSHLVMHRLFQNILEQNYHTDTKKILDSAAPIVIYSKDKKATLLLQLGYREFEVSRRKLIFGEHQSRFLFSQKIHHYLKAVKVARTAKRLALLALIEARTPYAEKDEYQLQTIEQALNKEKDEDRKSLADYNRVKLLLINKIERRMIENTHDFLHHHNDNFALLDKRNILEEMNLDFLKDQKD